MKLEEVKDIAVLGSGIMGHGIAQTFLMAGYPVMLYDIQETILDTAKAHVQKNMQLFVAAGLLAGEEMEPALKRLSTTTDLKKSVEASDFIIEAAPENLDLKRKLFEEVESFCRKDAIMASNTSSLTLGEIGIGVQNKERLVVTHWFNPPHIVPTVEVVRCEWTSDETFDLAYRLMEKIRKVPVKINRELPGFIVNRIQVAMAREVFDLFEKGLASAEDIDKAVRGSIGFRLASIGPLLTADLGGIELWLRVCENLLPKIQSSIDPPKALQNLVSQGDFGIKSGKGFYDYTVDFSKSELDAAVQKRDQEFLNRLKNLYWGKEGK
jgi:3-hydroxybutyryl-CoA dehydrogenase